MFKLIITPNESIYSLPIPGNYVGKTPEAD
jgi:hypothetical protein